jgi:hypothetical protein
MGRQDRVHRYAACGQRLRKTARQRQIGRLGEAVVDHFGRNLYPLLQRDEDDPLVPLFRKSTSRRRRVMLETAAGVAIPGGKSEAMLPF